MNQSERIAKLRERILGLKASIVHVMDGEPDDYYSYKSVHLDDVLASIDEMEQEEKAEIREPVQWFAEQMERKLKANDHKGGWSKLDDQYLLKRILEEVLELSNALAFGEINGIIYEAADVANFAMMIADNARAELERRLKEHQG